mmetsp:Transcript_33914/g.90423  ORF Transcript_33914/g.90423 Transcript_33914/m.90423 type:complete len:124 (-) Transcript_33914:203-574(-)
MSMNFGNEDESNDDVRWGSPSDSGRRCNLQRSPSCNVNDVNVVLSPAIITVSPSTASVPSVLDAILEETESQTESQRPSATVVNVRGKSSMMVKRSLAMTLFSSPRTMWKRSNLSGHLPSFVL